MTSNLIFIIKLGQLCVELYLRLYWPLLSRLGTGGLCYILLSVDKSACGSRSSHIPILSTDKTQMCYVFVRPPKHLYDEDYINTFTRKCQCICF